MNFLSFIIHLLLVLSSMAQKGQYMNEYTKTMRQFTGRLYSNIMRNSAQNSNTVFSPLSISQTMGMVLEGAKGRTKDQLLRAMMAVSKLDHQRIPKLTRKTLNNAVERPTGQKLRLANAVYLQEGFQVRHDYLDNVQEFYKSEVNRVNFVNAIETVNRINSWVENKTENVIKNLTNEDMMSEMTQLMLVNAIYFQADWKTSFEPLNDTCTFSLSEGNDKQVACMRRMDSMPYYEENGMEFVAVPYKSNIPKTSYMVLGKPLNGNLDAFDTAARKTLSSMNVSKWIKRKVKLTMPKFKFTKELDVKELLFSMGVRDLFSEQDCDLTGISETPLHVSHFIHKAHINVNENSTEAAASTLAVAIRRANIGPKIFNLDQPFFFAIYNELAGIFTFAGKVQDPTIK